MSYIPLLVIATLIILLTRWLPFIFAEKLKKAKMVESIGKQLPAYIMMLLLIYEIKVSNLLSWPYALPELISLAVITVIHLWQRRVLLSMLIGTLSYLLLLHWSW